MRAKAQEPTGVGSPAKGLPVFLPPPFPDEQNTAATEPSLAS